MQRIIANVKWLWARTASTHAASWVWSVQSFLTRLLQMIVGVALPAVVVLLINRRSSAWLTVSVLVSLGVLLGICDLLASVGGTREMWRNIGRRMHITFLDAQAALRLPYVLAMQPANKELRATAARHGFESDDSGFGTLLPTVRGLLENVLLCVLMALLCIRITWGAPILIFVSLALSVLILVQLASFRQRTNVAIDKLVLRQEYLYQISADGDAAEDLRLYGYRDTVSAQLDAIQHSLTKLERGLAGRTSLMQSLVAIISAARRSALLWVLVDQAVTQRISPATFTLYFGLLTTFEALAGQIARGIVALVAANEDATIGRRYIDYANAHALPSVATATTVSTAPIQVQFKNVSFAYPAATDNTINAISFTIAPNETIALVGLNGAGKTTITMLMMGLLKPSSGSIFINGEDTATMTAQEQLTFFTPMFQENIILADSVAMNIVLGQQRDEAKLEQAVANSKITAVAAKLPAGLATPMTQFLNNEGVNFSGGETQRLMLARLLYRDSPFVIMDEPTAALDPIAESQIYDQIHAVTMGKSSMFISHRLASTQFADRILFLGGGHIIATGTHQELLRTCPAYADLFATQSQYYEGANHDTTK